MSGFVNKSKLAEGVLQSRTRPFDLESIRLMAQLGMKMNGEIETTTQRKGAEGTCLRPRKGEGHRRCEVEIEAIPAEKLRKGQGANLTGRRVEPAREAHA